MKKIKIFTVFALLVLAARALHADPYKDFNARVTNGLIKPFALDLGGILGGASFYNGRALGFPGFRLDGMAVVQSRPDRNNLIMRNAGVKAFGFPMVEATIGLPYKIDVVAHGMQANHLTVFGGGLRYCLFKSGLLTKFIPNVGLAAFGDKVNHSAFKATHFSINAGLSWNLPIIEPFLTAGLDSTRVTVGSSALTPALSGTSATANGSRFAGGLELTPFPFTRIHAAFTLLHGMTGGNFGLAAQF